MQKKIRVLLITGGFREGATDGIASVLYNYGTSKPLQKDFQIDYLALGFQPFEPYREEIEALGSKLISLGIHSQGYQQYIGVTIKLYRFLKNNNYDIVHINSGVPGLVYVCCIAAKLAKKEIIIAHSHNSFEMNCKRKIFYPLFKARISKIADRLYACSKAAACSMFSPEVINKNEWVFLPNAIQTSKYEYNSAARAKTRNDLNISDQSVIGFVGTFKKQKNHVYLIRVFSEVLKSLPKATLLLIGSGELEDSLKALVKEMGIEKHVIFLGQRNDVNLLLNAMDVFVMPSRWEGYPVTLIEAQANNLGCIVSDKITDEVAISDLVTFFSLEDGSSACAEKVISYLQNNSGNRDKPNAVKSSVFDIEVSATELAKRYKSYVL